MSKPLTAEYDHRWRAARAAHLAAHPLCAFHEKRGEVVAASVVDHIEPHRGDVGRFWDEANWQSLCASCHSATKQRIEVNGYGNDIGVDGWPTDPRHPANRRKTLIKSKGMRSKLEISKPLGWGGGSKH